MNTFADTFRVYPLHHNKKNRVHDQTPSIPTKQPDDQIGPSVRYPGERGGGITHALGLVGEIVNNALAMSKERLSNPKRFRPSQSLSIDVPCIFAWSEDMMAQNGPP